MRRALWRAAWASPRNSAARFDPAFPRVITGAVRVRWWGEYFVSAFAASVGAVPGAAGRYARHPSDGDQVRAEPVSVAAFDRDRFGHAPGYGVQA